MRIARFYPAAILIAIAPAGPALADADLGAGQEIYEAATPASEGSIPFKRGWLE